MSPCGSIFGQSNAFSALVRSRGKQLVDITKYRISIAYLMSIWFMMLIIPGSISTHKEVTSAGEIVIHNHPYDFTKKVKASQI